MMGVWALHRSQSTQNRNDSWAMASNVSVNPELLKRFVSSHICDMRPLSLTLSPKHTSHEHFTSNKKYELPQAKFGGSYGWVRAWVGFWEFVLCVQVRACACVCIYALCVCAYVCIRVRVHVRSRMCVRAYVCNNAYHIWIQLIYLDLLGHCLDPWCR